MTTDDPPQIVWGRCRDARRWFWHARIIGGADEHGWAPDRNTAARKANAAAVAFADGRYAAIRVNDQAAETKLAAVRGAKRPKPRAEKRQHTAAGPPPYDSPRSRTATVSSVDELKVLKAAMAAAHPDRGGTAEAFIVARERYVKARRRAA